MKTQIDIILKQVKKEKIVFCPLYTKKPTDQTRKLDTIGFLNSNYLTASFYKGYTSKFYNRRKF